MIAPADPAPSDSRVFKCKVCDWILGESYREQGKRITQLRIYRHPCDQGDQEASAVAIHEHLRRPEVMFAAVQVNDCTVLCEHCGAETGWFANQNAIEMMIERRNGRSVKIKDGKHEPAT